MAKRKPIKSRGPRRRVAVFDFGAQEIFAELMNLLSAEDAALAMEDLLDVVDETLNAPVLPIPSPFDYEAYDASTVYSDATSSDSRTELDPELDFVEDDDVAHEFDT